jgi:hypothetical protein
MSPTSNQRFLTEEDIDAIADKAAERALEKVYAQVGKNVVTKLLWLIGIVAISLAMWMGGKDHLHLS